MSKKISKKKNRNLNQIYQERRNKEKESLEKQGITIKLAKPEKNYVS